MTKETAAMMNPEVRAKALMHLDNYLRNELTDEDLFDRWLEEGVPDGTGSWQELADVTAEEFAEMWNLAEKLMNEQLGKDNDSWEPFLSYLSVKKLDKLQK